MNEQQLADALKRLEADAEGAMEALWQSLAKWKRLLIEGAGFKVCGACGGTKQPMQRCGFCDRRGFIR